MTKIYIATIPVDMRRSFDSLAALIREELQMDPLLGNMYVFYNRGRDKLKVLYFDRNGYCLIYKRIEIGVFKVPCLEKSGREPMVIDDVDLRMLLDGMDITKVKRGKDILIS